jgi:hypothetical protein
MSRREFYTVAGLGTLGIGLASLFSQGCTREMEQEIVKLLLALPEIELVFLINKYRRQNGLSDIPISYKLMAVAKKHVSDLSTYHPEQACGGNLHSWSTNGNWKGGCFDPNNQSTWPIMWDKPKEIANYTWQGEKTCFVEGVGYENAASASTAQGALNAWINSTAGHREVILNQKGPTGDWSCVTWRALGAAYGGGYACAWFGESKD